jgi:hypothetical protein
MRAQRGLLFVAAVLASLGAPSLSLFDSRRTHQINSYDYDNYKLEVRYPVWLDGSDSMSGFFLWDGTVGSMAEVTDKYRLEPLNLVTLPISHPALIKTLRMGYKPMIVFPDAKAGVKYTLIMVDPDGENKLSAICKVSAIGGAKDYVGKTSCELASDAVTVCGANTSCAPYTKCCSPDCSPSCSPKCTSPGVCKDWYDPRGPPAPMRKRARLMSVCVFVCVCVCVCIDIVLYIICIFVYIGTSPRSSCSGSWQTPRSAPQLL